jgi:nucleoside-triphosphatase THEP1
LITIITGEINSGKTNKMRDLYSKTQSGDGFLCMKTIKNNIHMGYDLVPISQNNSMPFIRKKQFLKKSDKIIFHIGDYYFFEKAFYEAEEIIIRLLKEKIDPIYIDELGLLELQKKCFYNSIVKILKHNIPLILCVRKSCLQSIINLFNFSKYKIIEV